MHRIDADGHVANQFTDGDVSLGVDGTQVDADWLNAIQEEICGLLEKLGVTLVKGTNTQLLHSVGLQVARAWGTVRKNSNTPSLYVTGKGLTTPTSPSNFGITVVFATALPDTNYSVAATVNGNTCLGTAIRVENKTVNGFDVIWYDTETPYSNHDISGHDVLVDVVVFGNHYA